MDPFPTDSMVFSLPCHLHAVLPTAAHMRRFEEVRTVYVASRPRGGGELHVKSKRSRALSACLSESQTRTWLPVRTIGCGIDNSGSYCERYDIWEGTYMTNLRQRN